MVHNKEIGYIYDTIQYGVIFFNGDKLPLNNLMEYGDDNLQLFNLFKKDMYDIPAELYPFFYCRGQKTSFLYDYFYSKFDFFKESFKDFIFILENDTDLKKQIFLYYFDDLLDYNFLTEDMRYREITYTLLKTDFEKNLSIQIINLFYNFNDIFECLINYLQDSYKKICAFHMSILHKYKEEINSFSSLRVTGGLSAFFKLDNDTDMDTQQFAVSFFDYYVIIRKEDREKSQNRIFILGVKSKRTIGANVDYSHIKPEIICEALAHPVIRDILYALKNGQYSATQLSDILHVARQTVNRHLLWLKDELMIDVAKKDGHELYYMINNEFFQNSIPLMSKFIINFTDIK